MGDRPPSVVSERMFNKNETIYRKESLERLSSPERLDQLMQVVAPKDWLGLLAFGGLIVLGTAWSVFGKIPVTVDGRGILIYPLQVVELESPSEGKLQTLKVKVGDNVRKGDVLAVIDQSDLRTQVREQQARLTQLQRQAQELDSLGNERLTLELQTLRQQRQTLRQQLQNTQEFSPQRRSQERATIAKERRALEQQLQDLRALQPVLQTRLDSRKLLQRQGAIAADAVIQAEREFRDTISQIYRLQAQLQELQTRLVNNESSYQDNLSQISNLRAQLQDLDSREKVLLQQQLEGQNTRQNNIQEIRRQIAQLSQQLQTTGQIISPQNGRLLEVNVAPGQVLEAGTRFGAIASTNPTGKLVSLTYFSIKDGKRLQAGMAAQITPDSVKREEFGGIVGNLKTVSAFPITRQSIATTIGSTEVAEGLAIPGGQMEALIELATQPTSVSGYRWSSAPGPDVKLTAGTTVTVRVTLKEQSPISLVLPVLRSLSGI